VSKPEPGVLIVGGGVIGVCAAYYLAREGASVLVLEREEIGSGASFGNAGAIVPGHLPINKPGRVRQALRSLLDPLSPLYVAPHRSPGLVRWLWDFSRTCTTSHLEASMRLLGPMGHLSMELFQALMTGEESLDCGYRVDGYYEVYLTERGLVSIEEDAVLMGRHGYASTSVPGEELRQRDPVLSRRVRGGVFFPEAGTVNPHSFVVKLAERARGHGASFRTGCEVTEVRAENGRVRGVRSREGEEIPGDQVVLAAGAYTLPLARKLGIRLPLQPAKGYHADRRPGERATPPVKHAFLLGESAVFCTPMDGVLRLAGTLEFSGMNERIHRPRLLQLTRAAARYFDGVGEATPISEWCGLRPCISDGLPVMGAVPGYEGLYLATGHAMMGLTLGPVTGKLMAELLLHGSPSLDIGPLGVDRF
jgi:D-amino-acid dehydrogenase